MAVPVAAHETRDGSSEAATMFLKSLLVEARQEHCVFVRIRQILVATSRRRTLQGSSSQADDGQAGTS